MVFEGRQFDSAKPYPPDAIKQTNRRCEYQPANGHAYCSYEWACKVSYRLNGINILSLFSIEVDNDLIWQSSSLDQYSEFVRDIEFFTGYLHHSDTQ